MKKIATVLLLGLAFVGAAAAKDHAVKGYVKKDSTSVAPQVQTGPNATKVDNHSSKGNVGPVTVKEAAKDPYAVPLLKDARPLQ